MKAEGPCSACGRNPAAGYASVLTADGHQLWLCHGDDVDLSCYDLSSWSVMSGLPPMADLDCLVGGCRWGDARSEKCECAKREQ